MNLRPAGRDHRRHGAGAGGACVDRLGIRDAVLPSIGGSMGGMQVLDWASRLFPGRVFAAVPIACGARHSAQNIAFHEVGRQAIMADPEWRGVALHTRTGMQTNPARGLAVARMAAHITYLSEQALQRKFGRNAAGPRRRWAFGFDADFQVESYLRHQGIELRRPVRRQLLPLRDAGHGLFRPRGRRTAACWRRRSSRLGARASVVDVLHQRLAVPDAREPRGGACAQRRGGERLVRRGGERQAATTPSCSTSRSCSGRSAGFLTGAATARGLRSAS
jgi:hypothetical protein